MRQISPGLAGRRLVGQALLGVKDGTNTVFSTPRPFVRGGEYSESVFLRGLRRVEGVGCDYIAMESGGAGTGFDTVVFTTAPKTNDNLFIDYYPSGG